MRASTILGPALALSLALAVGCESGSKYASVSGRVTLNGQPLANATVSFQPIAEGSVNAPGPGSTAKTNANGEYKLMAADGRSGAWVGKHRVQISLVTEQVADTDARAPRGGWPQADKVPARYNRDSKEEFTVPAGGTDKADFALTAP
jgi:hypothetical protein